MEKITEAGAVLENLQRYTKELEKKHPDETAYWHLQKLRGKIAEMRGDTPDKKLTASEVLERAYRASEISGDDFALAKHILHHANECPACRGHGVTKESHGEEFPCGNCSGLGVVFSRVNT